MQYLQVMAIWCNKFPQSSPSQILFEIFKNSPYKIKLQVIIGYNYAITILQCSSGNCSKNTAKQDKLLGFTEHKNTTIKLDYS